MRAHKESGRKDIKVWLGGGGSKELVKKIIDNSDPLIKADVTYPPDVVATGVSLAVLGVRGRVFEGFYQKKLPVNIILNSEFIDSKNAKDYYHPDAPFDPGRGSAVPRADAARIAGFQREPGVRRGHQSQVSRHRPYLVPYGGKDRKRGFHGQYDLSDNP